MAMMRVASCLVLGCISERDIQLITFGKSARQAWHHFAKKSTITKLSPVSA